MSYQFMWADVQDPIAWVSPDQQHAVVQGHRFKAVTSAVAGSCSGCAMKHDLSCRLLKGLLDITPFPQKYEQHSACQEKDRKDGRAIIWVSNIIQQGK